MNERKRRNLSQCFKNCFIDVVGFFFTTVLNNQIDINYEWKRFFFSSVFLSF